MGKQLTEKTAAPKRRKGKAMMAMGLLLMMAALFLACGNWTEERQGEEAAGSALQQLEEVILAAEQTAGEVCDLVITDDAGQAMDWPLEADGRPMSWATDGKGNPLASVIDGQGRTVFWPAVTDEAGSAVLVGAEAWERAGDGSLLPFVSDSVGRRMTWPTDEAGSLMDWEALKAAWTEFIRSLLEQLTLETPLFVQHPEMEMPESKIDGRYYIGMLEVPDKNLRLPVMSDWSEEDLKIAPCRYSGSVYSRDIVIAGHNYYRHFRPVKWLEEGTEVRFTDVDGNVFVYEVTGRETIGGSDVEGMLAGEWDLTRFTCTTGGRCRIAVRCEIVEIIPA